MIFVKVIYFLASSVVFLVSGSFGAVASALLSVDEGSVLSFVVVAAAGFVDASFALVVAAGFVEGAFVSEDIVAGAPAV